MKTLYLIPFLFLSACSTPKAPKLLLHPQEPTSPIDEPGIRYPEVIGAYHLGRHVDPSNALHERHTVYRVEAASHWNLLGILPGDSVGSACARWPLATAARLRLQRA